MNTLLIILRILPLVLAAVHAVEQAIPLPGQGYKKLDLVIDVLNRRIDAGPISAPASAEQQSARPSWCR